MLNNNSILKQQSKKKSHNQSSYVHLPSNHLKKSLLSYNDLYQKPIHEKSHKKTPNKSTHKSKSHTKSNSHRLLTSYSQVKINNKHKNHPNEQKKFKFAQQKLESERLNNRKSSEKIHGKNVRVKTDYQEILEFNHQISTKNTSHSSNVYMGKGELEWIRKQFNAIQMQNGMLRKELNFYRQKQKNPQNSITKALR